jgi:hypothetical protein
MMGRWLYRTRLSVDGCFKLKQRERGIHDADIDSGAAYFVNEAEYRQYLKDTAPYVSTSVRHN